MPTATVLDGEEFNDMDIENWYSYCSKSKSLGFLFLDLVWILWWSLWGNKLVFPRSESNARKGIKIIEVLRYFFFFHSNEIVQKLNRCIHIIFCSHVFHFLVSGGRRHEILIRMTDRRDIRAPKVGRRAVDSLLLNFSRFDTFEAFTWLKLFYKIARFQVFSASQSNSTIQRSP